MLTIYFSDDTEQKNTMENWLNNRQVAFLSCDYKDIDKDTLLSFASKTPDFFILLKPAFLRYKLDYKTTLSEFLELVSNNKLKTLRFPIAVKDGEIFADVGIEDLGCFIPRKQRKLERAHIFAKAEKLDEGRRFWRNFEVVRKQSELRWFELNELLFADVSDNLGEIKKAKDRFFKYKNNKQIPPEDIIEKIQKIFLIERIILFQKSVPDLQNF